jgi:hypothetical protein
MPDLDAQFPKLKVFISYPVKDGFDKANQAANILKKAGHKAWIYDHSKTVGALAWREIANCIVNESDAVLYICTSSSLHSWGQGQEAGYALNHRKKIIVICLDDALVPIELTARWYEKLSSAQFREKFGIIATKLSEITNHIQKLDDGIVAQLR